MSADGPNPPAAAARRAPLSRLRTLKRSGLQGRGGQVRELLAELAALDEPLDLEAAGSLLSGAPQRGQLAAEGSFTACRIALLGSSTLDGLPPLLTATLLNDGVLPEIREAGFNQWLLEILSGAPHLKDLRPDVGALLLDDAAVLDTVTDPFDLDEVERRCAQFPGELGRWVGEFHRTLGGLAVLSTIPLSARRRDAVIDYRGKARLEAAWNRMNAAILDLAGDDGPTVVLSADGVAAHAGDGPFATDRMRLAAGHVYGPAFLRSYAAELARVVRARLGRAAKCLVLDLDNTLWGGVVGDDGVGALRIGGSYPGTAHSELQTLAKGLGRQGVMLAVCSKNEEATAREAIATHPEMVLGPDSFVAVSANWDPKPDNVRALAERLNIGADAMVFVDDNPVERGLMRELLPQVAVVELPKEPAGYAAAVAARGDFNLIRLTDEDRERTRLYRDRGRRAELRSGAEDLEGYLAALGSVLTVEPLGALNSDRIVQLFGKTNQFNLTGRRYPADEVAARTTDGTAGFHGVRLTDRFGDNGLIAALAVARDADGGWRIENFVLSCRVFARRVEETIVALLLRAAAADGAPAVRAGYAPTARNSAFAGFYPSLGFRPARAGAAGAAEFHHALRDLPAPSGSIRVLHEEEAFRAR
jgi:FkbH-like protein